jgi:hypothetical protein
LELGGIILSINAPMPGHERDVCVSLEVEDCMQTSHLLADLSDA